MRGQGAALPTEVTRGEIFSLRVDHLLGNNNNNNPQTPKKGFFHVADHSLIFFKHFHNPLSKPF
jgi:hypothetical protein